MVLNYRESSLLAAAVVSSKGTPRTELVSMAATYMKDFEWESLPVWEYHIDVLISCGCLIRSSPGHVEITAKGRDVVKEDISLLKSYLNNITADWEQVA